VAMAGDERRFERAALGLAERGYHVFPCRPRGKEPLTPRGFKDATRDERRILHWWDRWPDANIGIALGASEVCVLDHDSKHGADPDEVILGLGLEQHPVVWTGEAPEPDGRFPRSLSGVRGAHVYFRGRHPTRETELEGVELRGDGAYVLAPGSVHPCGVPYEGELPPVSGLQPLPENTIPYKRPPLGPAPPVERTIPKGRQHNTLVSLAGTMRRRGMDADEIAAALGVTNRTRLEEPAPDEHIERIARSVAKYPPADVDAVALEQQLARELGESERSERSQNGWRFEWKTLAEVAAEVPEAPDWIVPGFIAPATETLLFGPPKVGKSTLLCRCLAAAESGGVVFGLRVRRVSYVLLSEENAWTLQEKIFAFGLRGHGGEALLHARCNRATWLEVVGETVERCKEKGHELLVVDTFSRWAGLSGENENHAGAVQAAWSPLAAAKEAGIATVVLHHARKSGGSHGAGIRGSSAFGALPDVLLELSRTGGEDEAARVLNANSRFRDTPSVLGLTYTGDDYEVTSDIATLRGGTRAKLVAALRQLGPVTRVELAESVGLAESTVSRHLAALEEDGAVYHTGAGAGNDPHVFHLAER
jgi:DNA-binding transcriptional ArsR family regulator